MSYEHDMNDEKPPKRLLDKGWRKFTVKTCTEEQSKAGNDMFIITLLDQETDYIDTIYLISTEGKRWALKNLLAACGVAAAADGVYKWDIADIINKEVSGLIGHEPNEYINRSGDTVKTTQHRIIEFKEIAWDE